jgi:hypothetical protein
MFVNARKLNSGICSSYLLSNKFSRNTVPLENTPKVQYVAVHGEQDRHVENKRKRKNLSVVIEYEYLFFFSLTNSSQITEKIFDQPREYSQK